MACATQAIGTLRERTSGVKKQKFLNFELISSPTPLVVRILATCYSYLLEYS
ncbi:hypothetical protein A0J48_023585 [Sphaerospermopsis aphanizomenoides BCCUSP55]|uniref:hypothetical protein n=1 Tax=Sphaerospermopsis aphanizomenoides TaxID=459663 RepID=UPI0019038F3F|nr:hypothetical protein [Sphaerospermopsis aphanizomenoides]MBK1990471.1 hypothetical protein [Sphaerospermopsis aphanizomenoides BCCUSP55]